VLAAAEHTRTLLTKREGNQMYVRRLPLSEEQAESVNAHPNAAHTHRSGSQTFMQTDMEEIVEVMAVNEFDSDRKRMSVLVRIQAGATSSPDSHKGCQYLLLVKGADSSVLPVCNIDGQLGSSEAPDPAAHSATSHNWALDTVDHIELFASTGLRTLVFAQKRLTEEEAYKLLEEHTQASKQLLRRYEALSQVAQSHEKDLELLGAVGVEDELQVCLPVC
jgi:phospholipid-transporting ATPase